MRKTVTFFKIKGNVLFNVLFFPYKKLLCWLIFFNYFKLCLWSFCVIGLKMDSNSIIRVYRYRWVILSLYCLITIINFMQLMQFTIVADIMARYVTFCFYLIYVIRTIFLIFYSNYFYYYFLINLNNPE